MASRPENFHEQKKLVLAGCVIIRDGKILLLHRKNPDQYELPGGKVENGERPHITAKRELKEELSCDVMIKRHIGTKDFEEMGHTMQYEWFTVEIPEGQTPLIGEPEKYDRFDWIPIAELRNHNLSPNMKNLMEKLENF